MSEAIFIRAKKYADKVLKLCDLNKKAKQYYNDFLSVNNKYRYTNYTIQVRHGRDYSHTPTIFFGANVASPAGRNSFLEINPNGKVPYSTCPMKLMHIESFSEDLDFQLQTVFDKDELLDYYISCLLFSAGFDGYLRRDIAHNTLSALIRHIEEFYDYELQKECRHSNFLKQFQSNSTV